MKYSETRHGKASKAEQGGPYGFSWTISRCSPLGRLLKLAPFQLLLLARPRTLPTGFIAPCLPTKADTLPSGGLWLHEIKHDRPQEWRAGEAIQPACCHHGGGSE
jgi:hypothetical protein